MNKPIPSAEISAENAVTLPEDLRARLGVEPGDRLEFVESEDGSMTLRKQRKGIMGLKGIIKLGRPVSDEEIMRAREEMREHVGRHGRP